MVIYYIKWFNVLLSYGLRIHLAYRKKKKKLPIPFQNELYNKINEIGFNGGLPINGLLHSNVHKSANK